jgi:hypothetical protein
MIIQRFTYGRHVVSGIPVVSLYNGNTLASGHLMTPEQRQPLIDDFETQLADIEFDDVKTIYEMSFARMQEKYMGPIAKKYGFKCFSRTRNPNTDNPIAVYIRMP